MLDVGEQKKEKSYGELTAPIIHEKIPKVKDFLKKNTTHSVVRNHVINGTIENHSM